MPVIVPEVYLMASRPPKSSRASTKAAEACREARANTLRRSGWQRGESYPDPDDQWFRPRKGTLIVQTIGSGADSLVLRVSQDYWKVPAQYTVSVDGQQIGSILSAGAIRSSGKSDTLTVKGDWATGPHIVEVKLLNDGYGGSWDTDRNLHIDGASYNGWDLNFAASLPDWRPVTFSFTGGPRPSEFSDTPVWADEFNGTSINENAYNWTNIFSGPCWDGGDFDWEPSQISVSNGQLHIGITRGQDGRFDVGGIAAYTDQETGGFGFTYGKVDILAKASQEQVGAGICFLIWPEKDNHWPPEYDIVETPHAQGSTTNHWQGPNGNGDNQFEPKEFTLNYSQWHTYTLEWTPTRMTTLIDGIVVGSFITHVTHEPMSVGLMGYVGAAAQQWYGGHPDPSFQGLVIDVEYVRVYPYEPPA